MEEKTEEILVSENVEETETTTEIKEVEEVNTTPPEEVKPKSGKHKKEKVKETNNDVVDNLIKEKKPLNKKLIIFLTIAIVLLLLFISTIFAILNMNNNKIISGIKIMGIDVSGLSQEEASQKLNKIVEEKLSSEFNLIHDDYKLTVVPEQLGISFDIDSAVKTAYERGRSNNIFISNFQIVSSFFCKTNIAPSSSFNEDAIKSIVTEIESNLPDRLIEPNYYIEDSNLIISKGINGIVINTDLLKLKILSNINNFNSSNEDIVLPIEDKVASKIDIDKIYEEIHTEPKDAYFTKDPFTVYPHVDGVDFEISIEDAKKIIEEDKESYTIPLKITSPNVTTDQIGSEAFPDLLATYSTTFATSNVSRSTNIRLAGKKINGVVLAPGKTFSYNSTVGKRTEAAGFKTAAVYAGGEVTTGIGGGICQVSSTLYNSVLLSNLQIVERYNHGFNPGYVPAGRDATVSWGGPDFKFKNSRNYPIKISCVVSGGRITVSIYGVKEANEPEVSIESYVTSYIQYKTITTEDSNLPAGTTKVIESGSNGCNSVCYRVLKQNGNIISKTLLSRDTYSPHNRIVNVGPNASTTPSTTPTPTPVVTPTPTEEITPTPTPTVTPTPTEEVTPTPTPDIGGETDTGSDNGDNN